jgi:hypothetical protein
LIGALLGLLKLFSLISLFNQRQFEKELESTLADDHDDEKEKEF